jgi:hypothetical protein
MEEADRGREGEEEARGPAALAVHRCRWRLKGREGQRGGGRGRQRMLGMGGGLWSGREEIKKERERGEGLTRGPTSGWLG